jgi:hypothetical protein
MTTTEINLMPLATLIDLLDVARGSVELDMPELIGVTWDTRSDGEVRDVTIWLSNLWAGASIVFTRCHIGENPGYMVDGVEQGTARKIGTDLYKTVRAGYGAWTIKGCDLHTNLEMLLGHLHRAQKSWIIDSEDEDGIIFEPHCSRCGDGGCLSCDPEFFM